MFSILYNGVTIPLPDNDDFYSVFSQDNKMFTTDFELPITPEMIDVFRLRGILTQEDGEFFTPVQLPCELQGYGVRIPCVMNVDNVSQTKNTVTISLKGLGLYGNDYYGFLKYYPDVLDAAEYPLYYNNPQNNIFWAGIRADWSNNQQTRQYMINTPAMEYNDIVRLLSTFNYQLDNLPTDICVVPNKIMMDARYKMRRVFAGLYTRGNQKIMKGDYYNLYDDKFNFHTALNTPLSTASLTNTFTTKEYTDAMRVYYSLDLRSQYSPISTQYINIEVLSNNNDWRIKTSADPTEQQASYNITLRKYRIEIPLYYVTGDGIEVNYFELINMPAGDYEFILHIGWDVAANVSLFIKYQYVFKDNCEGTRQIIGNPDDESYDTPTSEETITTTGSFNSSGWGLRPQYDYSGEITTNFIQDTEGFELVRYNYTPALMVTNKYACFDGVSLYSILQNIANILDKYLFVSSQTQTIDFVDDITTTAGFVGQHILFDKIEFDDEYVRQKKYSYFNKVIDGEDAIDTNNVFMGYVPSASYALWMNNTSNDPLLYYFDNTGTAQSLLTSRTVLYVLNTNNIGLTDYTQLFYDADITMFGRPKRLINTVVFVLNENADGYFVSQRSLPGITVINQNSHKNEITTTLNRGQIVTVRLMGYIPYQYVVYQTRTFRVLTQELGADGVNEVTLLLYM